jgi:hypothetical protein
MKKGQHLLESHSLCVFRKWLGGDPDRFDLIACFDEFGAGGPKKDQGLFNLGTIRRMKAVTVRILVAAPESGCALPIANSPTTSKNTPTVKNALID